MRFWEFKIVESRGVTAREPGEVYVSDANPEDKLTFQSSVVLPAEGYAYQTAEELEAAIQQTIPADAERVDDNKPNKGTLAAIVAHTTKEEEDGPHSIYHVRYLKAIPAKGVHGTWSTLRGYKYEKGARNESIPIKPSDIIDDEEFRSPQELAEMVKDNVAAKVNGTEYQPLASIISQAVDLAMQGKTDPIIGGAQYSAVIGKYAGEFLGPIAVVAGNVRNGDIGKMLQIYKLKSLAGSTISFPGSLTQELVDSYIRTPKGIEIGVSTKLKQGGGAASSLKGIVPLMTPEIREAYPRGSSIIDLLGGESSTKFPAYHQGPLDVAKMYGIIDDADIEAMNVVDRASKNIADLGTENLQNLTSSQGVKEMDNPAYRVYFHALAAIVNQMVIAVNDDEEFGDAMKAALNNNNFLQLLTDVKIRGKDLVLDYSGKYPAVYEGKPVLRNKAYFATGQKGRIGFKMA
jgi:hypothetical protein